MKVYPNLDTDRIKVIPNGIEKNKFRPLKKEKYILLVSRLFINKGVQDLIEAVKDLNMREWKVKIVGEGPYRKSLEELVEKYKLDNKVEFLGWIDNKSEKLKELYGKASIFILSSWFENMSTTLLEAMQSGCIVVVSNIGSNRGVVTDSGILFKPKNPDDLREKIKQLTENPESLTFYQQKTRERVENFFDWNIVINKYTELL